MDSIARRYGVDDLEKLARDKTLELSAFISEDLHLEWPPKWDLCDWEIEWFMRAYREYSLFELKPRIGKSTTNRPSGCPHVGYAGPTMFLNAEGKAFRPRILSILGMSYREAVQPRVLHSVLGCR